MEYKGMLIVPARGGTLKQIKAKGRGSVPKALRGMYTTAKEAMLAIDAMPPKRKKKEANDGQTDSVDRD